MAYPATVPSDFNLGGNSVRAQFALEYLGNEYAFVAQNAVNGIGDCKLHIMKSTDFGQTWAESASLLPDCVLFQFGAGFCYTVAQDGTNVIVVFVRATIGPAGPGIPIVDGLTVAIFSLLTETFGASTNYTTVQVPLNFAKYNKPPADTGDYIVLRLAVRGTGDYILYYSIVAENVGGTLRGRCGYSTFDGTTFGASVALPNQAGSALSFIPTSVICEPTSGRTHFFYTDSTGGVGNKIYMLENAIYSVISPESCAAIIYRDSKQAERAASALRLTAQDLFQFGLIDGIIPEPGEGAHTDADQAAKALRGTLGRALEELSGLTAAQLIEQRYEKFRKMGNFFTE